MIVKVEMFGIDGEVSKYNCDGGSTSLIECKRVMGTKVLSFDEMLVRLDRHRSVHGDDGEAFFNQDFVIISSRESFQNVCNSLFEHKNNTIHPPFLFTEFTIEDMTGKIFTYLVYGVYDIYFMEGGKTFDRISLSYDK